VNILITKHKSSESWKNRIFDLLIKSLENYGRIIGIFG
jgi:hypothetical protein